VNTTTLRARIRSGAPTLGGWLTFGHSGMAELMANAGYDWVVVDLEHSVTAIDTAAEMIRAIDLSGSSPLVRLTSNNPDQVKRVMDAGAHGIIVPMVNAAAEAERAVASVHYAPQGNRGAGLGRAQGYGARFQEYFAWQKDNPVVIVQIEHVKGVENLEAILSVPGVDGFIVGPYDLSCSMGIPGQFEHADFTAAMKRIRSTGERLGAAAGLHIVEPDVALLEKCLSEGYRLIAYGCDIRFLDVLSRQGVARFREITAK
jgi:2-keto-3-deoxy-L-rhamnonate aldolase RhmA